jgi:hypothetical protein
MNTVNVTSGNPVKTDLVQEAAKMLSVAYHDSDLWQAINSVISTRNTKA